MNALDKIEYFIWETIPFFLLSIFIFKYLIGIVQFLYELFFYATRTLSKISEWNCGLVVLTIVPWVKLVSCLQNKDQKINV